MGHGVLNVTTMKGFVKSVVMIINKFLYLHRNSVIIGMFATYYV